MRFTKIAILSFFILLFFSFQLPDSRNENQVENLNNSVKELFNFGKKNIKGDGGDINFWKRQQKRKEFSHPALQATINYQIGKNYVLKDIDSAFYYVSKASLLIDKYDNFPLVKASVYNGLGNITIRKQKLENATYYHNKAAILTIADSLHQIPVLDKVIILLSASNVNTLVGRNLDAIDLLENARLYTSQIEEQEIQNQYLQFVFEEKFKAYNRFDKKKNDSLLYFLTTLEQLSRKNKDKHKLDWYYGNYYQNINELDSSIHRFQKSVKHNLDLLNSGAKETLTSSVKYNYYKSNLYLAEVLFLNGSIEKARKTTQLCSKLRAEIGYFNARDEADYYENLANFHFSLNDINGYKISKEKEIQARKQLEEVMTHDFYRQFKTVNQLEEKEKSISSLRDTVSRNSSKLTYAKIIVALLILAMVSLLLLARSILLRRRADQKMQETQNVLLEQKLLRTQMEPHFIFNTLNTLKSLINLDYKEKSLQYLSHFSRLLRNSLELSRREFVLVKEEVDTLKSYLSLQEIRSNYQFDYKIEFDSEIDREHDRIPPMLIQPFVENAIIHGFRNIKHKGLIIISLKKLSNKVIMIRIADNGNGVNHDLAKLNHKSLSGTIAKERLAILSRQYDTDARYELESKEGKGTIVVLYLPLTKKP